MSVLHCPPFTLAIEAMAAWIYSIYAYNKLSFHTHFESEIADPAAQLGAWRRRDLKSRFTLPVPPLTQCLLQLKAYVLRRLLGHRIA